MEQVEKNKSFFGRTGGKHFSKKDILPFIKDLEYKTYCEPFVGAGSIFLGREKKAEVEVINDFDPLVINLWEGMKECGSELKDYKGYFMDKSVFKWYLLKEKQNRRMKKKQELKDIENLKEDLYITSKSFSQNNEMIDYDKNIICQCISNKNICKCKNKELCLCSKTEKELRDYSKKIYKYINLSRKKIFTSFGDSSLDHFFRFSSSQFSLPIKENYDKLTKLYSLDKMEGFLNYPIYYKLNKLTKDEDLISTASQKDVKIETLKEDLFITRCSRSQDNINVDQTKSSSNSCSCSKTIWNRKIENLKEDIFITSKSFCKNNITPDKNELEKCGCINNNKATRKGQDLKIETFKEDLYITNKSFTQNNIAPNKKVCKKGKSIYTTKHYREDYKIETLKEDIFITFKSYSQANIAPNKKFVVKNECYDQTAKINDNLIETLKEDIFIYKGKEFGSHYTNGSKDKPLEKQVSKNGCRCIKNDVNSNKNRDLKIENLKEDLYITKLSRTQDNKNPLHNCNTCPDIKHKRSEVKIENLKEDIYITKNGRFSDNGSDKPNQKLLNEGCSHLREKQLETKIEEKADEDVCCSIEKTEEGLKLVKKKYYVRNKKYKGDETKWRLHNPNLCGWNNILNNCDKYQERLKDTIIHNGDYKKMIELYDSEETLFYFDPPWTKTGSGKKGDKCYSGFVELQDFYNSIKNIKGKWFCSYNNDDEILETFKDHKIEYINTVYTQKKAGDKKTVDILIFSKNFLKKEKEIIEEI